MTTIRAMKRPTSPLTWFAVLPVLLAAAASTRAQAPAARVDHEGLPLPDGAIARVGTGRFRHGDSGGRDLTFSPDGRMIAAVNIRGVHVFDTADGRLLHRIPVASNLAVSTIRFVDGGRQLAVAVRTDPDGYRLWRYDFAARKVVRRTLIPGGHSRVLAVTPDGAGALVRGEHRSLSLVNVDTGRPRWTVDSPRGATVAVPDDYRFLIVRDSGTEVRSTATGKIETTFATPEPELLDGPTSRENVGVARATDGTIAICYSKAHRLFIRRPNGDSTAHDIPRVVRGTWPTFCEFFFLCFSPDGRFLACGDTAPRRNRGTFVWDLAKPEQREPAARLLGAHNGTFSPDGKMLALDLGGVLSIWRTADWTPAFDPVGGADTLGEVFFSPDGLTVYGRSEFGWSAWPADGGPGKLLAAETADYFSWRLSANGQVAVGVPRSGKKLLVDLIAEGRKLELPLKETEHCPWLELNPDGRSVKIDVSDRRVERYIVYDTRTGQERARYEPPADTWLVHADIAADGAGLARSVEVDDRRTVRVTDHRTGERRPLPFDAPTSGFKFSPDGRRVVAETVLGDDGREFVLEAFDVTGGRRIAAFGKVDMFWRRYDISADGRSVVSGDYKGNVRVFEVATGGERRLFRHESEIRSVAFDGKGGRVVASSDDAPAYIWDLLGQPGPWDVSAAAGAWADLASTDAARGYRVVAFLRSHPREAVAFLRDRMAVPTMPAADAVAARIARLDGADFRDRERAQRELALIADLIRPHLKTAQAHATEEARRRLAQLRDAADTYTPDHLRQVRACEVLEANGSAEAVDVLRRWASGPDGAWLTAEARESLDRGCHSPDRREAATR